MSGVTLLIVLAAIFGVIGLGGFSYMESKKKKPRINYTGHKSRTRNLNSVRNLNNNMKSMKSKRLSPKKLQELMNARKLRELNSYDKMQSRYRKLMQTGGKTRNKTRRNKTRRNKTRRNKRN